jgi:hypothetical protein
MKMSSKRARLPETSSSAQNVTDEYNVFLAPPTLTRQSNTWYDPNLNPVYDQLLRTASDCKTHDTSKNSASVAFDVQSTTKIHIDTGYESDNSLTGDAYDEKLLKYFSPSPSKLPSTYEYDPHYWIANNESVPVLPSFYPVFRSSISIHKGSARLIAERIKAVLYARSIVAVYDSRGAKADCITKSNVNFRIRLYQSNKNDAIIVELHRQEGFDLTYQDDMYAIFDAAKGKAHVSTQEESPNYIALTDCISKDEVLNDEDQQTKPSLKIISELMLPDNGAVSVDNVETAMTWLLKLTNVDKMGAIVASKAARDLTCLQEYATLRVRIVSNIISPPRENPHCSQTHRVMLQSLEILANVVQSLLGDQEEYDLSWIGSMALQLIVLIENAAADPRAADLSCLILKNSRHILSLSDDENTRLKEALLSANSFGREVHADLELHSKQCMESMYKAEL